MAILFKKFPSLSTGIVAGMMMFSISGLAADKITYGFINANCAAMKAAHPEIDSIDHVKVTLKYKMKKDSNVIYSQSRDVLCNTNYQVTQPINNVDSFVGYTVEAYGKTVSKTLFSKTLYSLYPTGGVCAGDDKRVANFAQGKIQADGSIIWQRMQDGKLMNDPIQNDGESSMPKATFKLLCRDK